VVVYGGAESVAGVRARAPAGVRVIEHGPKLGLGVVQAAQASDRETARAAALDVSVFDQQGCVSPHTLYVEGDVEAARGFGRLLAAALAEVEALLPRGRLTTAETAAIQQTRGAAEFRDGVDVFTPAAGTAWTVIVDPDPAFAVSCLNRVVYVKPLAQPDELGTLLAPVRAYLQTVGVAGDAAFQRVVAA